MTLPKILVTGKINWDEAALPHARVSRANSDVLGPLPFPVCRMDGAKGERESPLTCQINRRGPKIAHPRATSLSRDEIICVREAPHLQDDGSM